MKAKIVTIGFLILSFFLLTYTTSNSLSPEDILIGEWKELSWDYEKLNDTQKLLGGIFTSEKEDVRVHTAESWIFKPEGVLVLLKEGQETLARWTIKGRGNILEIKDEGIIERYDITKLDQNKIELNYLSEIQIKGAFGKLIFEKL